PMVRYYFFRGPKPVVDELYNPLQKLAYLSTYGFGMLAIVSGLLLAQPVQLGAWFLRAPWTWQTVRALHFVAMLGFLVFVPGHIVMVAISGLPTLMSMVTGECAAMDPYCVGASGDDDGARSHDAGAYAHE